MFPGPGEAEEAVFLVLVVAAVVPCRERVEEEGFGPEWEPAAAAELPGFRVQEAEAARVSRARGAAGEAPFLESGVVEEVVFPGLEAVEEVGHKGVEVVVLGSFPCLVGVLDRDQDWCPGPQEAQPGQRHDRLLSRRPR